MPFAKQVGSIVINVIGRFARAATIIMALVFSSVVHAQGTSGTLPDPMSTRELNDYADRLGLSDQQRVAMAEMHDQYKAEFKTLRENEIDAFLKEMRTMQGVMPKREQIKDFVDKMNRLNGKIASIDSRLFDQLQTVLTPEQQAKLPRVRQARQRARYSASQMMMMSGAPIVDLSGIFHDLDLPPDQQAQVDPMISQYESKLTSEMGKLFESSGNMFLDMFEALEKAGFADADVNDPQVQVKVMETMQTIWQDLLRNSLDQSMVIHTLNRRTAKSISASLASEHGRALLNRFYRQAYRELGLVTGNNGETIAAALKLDDLTPEQREQIQAAQIEFHSKIDRLIEETADVVDESRRNFSPWAVGSEEGKERQKTIATAGQKAAEIGGAAVKTLMSMLSQEQYKRAESDGMKLQQKAYRAAHRHVLVESSADDDAEDDFEIEDEGDDDDEDDDATEEMTSLGGQAWSGDMFLPTQIDRRQLNEYADRLNLGEEQRAVLNELHRSYSERYQAVKDNEFAMLAKLVQSMWTYDEKTQTTAGPTSETIAKSYELRTAAITKIREADEALFDDIGVALTTDENQSILDRLRLSRERQRYLYNSGWMAGMGGSNESGVELSSLLRRSDPQAMKAVDGVLAEYEKTAAPLFAARFQAGMELQRAQELWQATMYAAQRSESGIASAMSQFREIMSGKSIASAQANAKVAELNRATLDKIVALLPGEQGEELRDQYNKLAFPNVHNDGAALHKRLNHALKLETTTPEQRQKLHDLVAEYRPAYAQLSQQMVQASTGSEGVNVFSGDPKDAEKWQLREETLAKLRFDRNELNSRAAQKLKSILNSEQLAQIGGLPTVPE